MNRRAFLTGLLASTAAVPLARAAPLLPDKVAYHFVGYGGGLCEAAHAVYWQDRLWWINGNDAVLHWEWTNSAKAFYDK